MLGCVQHSTVCLGLLWVAVLLNLEDCFMLD